MWQARTTKEFGTTCFHAHFQSHAPRPGPRYDNSGKVNSVVEPGSSSGGSPDITLMRHYHPDTHLGYCEGHDRHTQTWGSYRWGIGFDVRENKRSDRWPEEPGTYIFVKHTHERLVPIYVGYTDNLKVTLSNPMNHHAIGCIDGEGVTHIHARLNDGDDKNEDAAYLVNALGPPCNEDQRTRLEMGTELVEGHIISLVGKSGKEYTYSNDGNYPNVQGNYIFAKYDKWGFDPQDWNKLKYEWKLLFAGETDSLEKRLRYPDVAEIQPWECAVTLGATHIFTRENEGDRHQEVIDLQREHYLPCNAE